MARRLRLVCPACQSPASSGAPCCAPLLVALAATLTAASALAAPRYRFEGVVDRQYVFRMRAVNRAGQVSR